MNVIDIRYHLSTTEDPPPQPSLETRGCQCFFNPAFLIIEEKVINVYKVEDAALSNSLEIPRLEVYLSRVGRVLFHWTVWTFQSTGEEIKMKGGVSDEPMTNQEELSFVKLTNYAHFL